jgi:hypothetical protein
LVQFFEIYRQIGSFLHVIDSVIDDFCDIQTKEAVPHNYALTTFLATLSELLERRQRFIGTDKTTVGENVGDEVGLPD